MGDVYKNDDSLVRLYKPKGVYEIYRYGSSASIGRVKTGIILKAQRSHGGVLRSCRGRENAGSIDSGIALKLRNEYCRS